MPYIDNITWRPGFNDPEPLGWIGFSAYCITSVLCFRAARVRAMAPHARRAKFVWILLGLALALLGINVQLDLHALFFQWARQVAEAEGWYRERRALQRTFILILAVAACGSVIIFAWKFSDFVKNQRLAIFGALLIVAYALLRGASFNHFDDGPDSLLEMKDGLRLLELAGVAAIGLAAWRFPNSHAASD